MPLVFKARRPGSRTAREGGRGARPPGRPHKEARARLGGALCLSLQDPDSPTAGSTPVFKRGSAWIEFALHLGHSRSPWWLCGAPSGGPGHLHLGVTLTPESFTVLGLSPGPNLVNRSQHSSAQNPAVVHTELSFPENGPQFVPPPASPLCPL